MVTVLNFAEKLIYNIMQYFNTRVWVCTYRYLFEISQQKKATFEHQICSNLAFFTVIIIYETVGLNVHELDKKRRIKGPRTVLKLQYVLKVCLTL